MYDLPRKRSEAPKRMKTLSTDTLFTLTLIIGVLIGLALMVLVGYGLIIMDDLDIIDVPYVDPSGPRICPPGDLSACPTCMSEPLLPTAAETPLPSATPDLAATATSACADFEDQFPGTPCP
jgi:hypothetical protein